MEVAVVYGLKQHRDELIATNPQVVITSYASFRPRCGGIPEESV